MHLRGLVGNLRALEAKLDVLAPLIDVHVGELVVAEGVGQVLGIVGDNEIIIVSEVGEHVDEVLAGVGKHVLVLLQPVEKFFFVVRTV